MAMHWKSAKGYINVKQMEDKHLAKAWALVLRNIEDNALLPKSLVEAAGLDMYDDEPLHELAFGFQTEWERRLEERALDKTERTQQNFNSRNQYSGYNKDYDYAHEANYRR